MLIIGELINTSRTHIQDAVEGKDAAYIQKIAREQVEAGADYLDVNCGTRVFDEVQSMEWLVHTIQEAVQSPLCIDSPNPLAIAAGLELACYGQSMVNSISGEQERFARVLPLIQKYKSKTVALCMDDQGIPETAEDRLRVADKLLGNLLSEGIEQGNIYFDPLIKPLAVNHKFGLEVLDSVKYIHEKYPQVHFICGLSNISYGLPERKLLNRTFMVMNVAVGMDGFILDPLDRAIMSMLGAASALAGNDEYCMEYISGVRAGMIKA